METQESEFYKAVKCTNAAKSVNKMLKEWYARARDAASQQRKVAWSMVGVPSELFTTFDVDAVWPENFGTVCASRQVAVHFMSEAEADGYSMDLCSYSRNSLGYLRRRDEVHGVPPEAPLGGLAEPDMLITPGRDCDIRMKWFQAQATRFGKTPMHIFEVPCPPYGSDLEDEDLKKHYIKLHMDGLKGFVSFLEQHTGKKYDEARLSQAIVDSQEALRLFYEIDKLRRTVPSPMPSEDHYSVIIPELFMLGEKFAVDFYRMLYEEVKARVDNKVGVIPDEKYRLGWVGLPTWFNLGIFNYFEKFGAVFAIETTYHAGVPVQIDASRPLEALAERAWLRAKELHRWGAEAEPEAAYSGGVMTHPPAQMVAQIVRDYKLDGVLLHTTKSCRIISFGQQHTRNELRKLGVPVMVLESDMTDPRAWSDAAVRSQIDGFLELVASNKERE